MLNHYSNTQYISAKNSVFSRTLTSVEASVLTSTFTGVKTSVVS